MKNGAAAAGYTALRERVAWLDLSGRGTIRVLGEDRARLLHAMTTNDVASLQPGQGCYAFFLNAQGRILADVNILCLQDHFLLDTEPELTIKVYEHLDRYIIADDVTIENETDTTARISLEGPQAASALAELGAPAPTLPYGCAVWGNSIVVKADTTGSGGYLVMLPSGEKAQLMSQLEDARIPRASSEEARVARIEQGLPRYGEEISDRYLVQETGQLRAISFHKGCYLGQEIVERVRSRGQVHRVLRRLEIDTASPPEAGAKLTVSGAPAAEVASAVFSPALGKTVALAYVRTQFADPGTALELDGALARVTPAAA